MNKYLQWVLWSLIAIIVFIAGMNHLIDALIHSKKDRIVPNIIGKNIADSLDMLSSLNLYLKKTSDEFNPDVPAGIIISQAPSSGSVIKEGRAVNVIVSAGGEVIFAPDLTNQTVRSAQMVLRKNGLDLGEQDEKYSLVIEQGRIISQNPPPRTSIKKNGLVNIMLSLGQPPEGVLLVPDFVKKNVAEAEVWSNKNGIKIKNENKVKDPSMQENTIIKQMPESGGTIDKTQQLELWISSRE